MSKSKNDKYKEFLSTAVHDIREPVRTISSFSSILKLDIEKNDNASAIEDLRYIDSATERLSDIIEKLNLYFRTVHSNFYPQKLNVSDVLEKALLELEKEIQSRKALIRWDIKEKIKIDYNQFLRLLTELISNAIKFNQNQPEVSISEKIENDHYVLSIKDNGIGIEDEFIHKLFEPFYRTVSKEEYAGTGLGLTISKHIVDNLNGDIKVVSALNKGTTVIISLPI
jgi:two-component system, chemotaxis family, CheB/CheR fusion protein